MMMANGGAPLVALEPEDEAAAVAAVKAFARVSLSDDDAVIADAVTAAIGLAERFTGQVMICRTVTVGVAAALPSGAYAIDIDASGDGYVRVTAPGTLTRLEVTVSAGMAADWASVPMVVRQGVVMLATHLIDQRDAAAAPPAAVSALWRPFRRIAIGGECGR